MKTALTLAVLAALAASPASAQLALKVDPRGTIAEVRVGDAVYLQDVGVALVKPGWTGNLADQCDVDPSTVRVHREGANTTYTMPLRGTSFAGRLIERIVRDGDDGVSLEFEVIPEEDVELETVLLRGSLAVASHAGTTSYLVGAPGSPRGVLPKDLNADKYIVWSGDPEWLGLARPGAGGLRVQSGDMGLQLQDDRKWGTPAFGLLATAGGGEHLARKPIRFALSLRAEAAGRLEADLKALAAPARVRLDDDRPLAVKAARIDRDRLGVFSTVTVDAEVENVGWGGGKAPMADYAAWFEGLGKAGGTDGTAIALIPSGSKA